MYWVVDGSTSDSTRSNGLDTDQPDGLDTDQLRATKEPHSQRTSPPRCPYCNRVFPEPRLLTLHLGLEHEHRLEETERDAFERAYRAETDEIRRFRLKLLLLLLVVYFGLLFVYAFVT